MTARAYGMPIVLSTVGVKLGFNRPTLPSILSELDGIELIDRTSMNAFEDEAFRQAVQATGRRRLIIGGLHTEICLTFATVQALKDGYDVLYVGGRSQVAHRTAIERLAHAGAVPTTALAVVTELFRDWAGPLAGPAGDVIYWYFREVPKLTDAVGVAEAEKRRVSSRRQLRWPGGWRGSTRQANHHRVKPAGDSAGQRHNRVFERHRFARKEQ